MDLFLYNYESIKLSSHLSDFCGKSVEQALRGYSSEEKECLITAIEALNNCIPFVTKEFNLDVNEDANEIILLVILKWLDLNTRIIGSDSFYEKFNIIYWENIEKNILKIWREYPNDDKRFIDFFSQILDFTIDNLPNVCIKQLRDFKNIYRACTHHQEDCYNYIIPVPEYAKDNRWNDDGIANLYLSYDNEDKKYKNIKMAQRTCFSELKLQNEADVVICEFKALRRKAKILDLSYQQKDSDTFLLDCEKEVNGRDLVELISKTEPDLFEKLCRIVIKKDKKQFDKDIKKYRRKTGLENIQRYEIEETLIRLALNNICNAIFCSVDKEEDPQLELYVPFRKFSKYLIAKGFDGIAYKSTRMELKGLEGTCLIIFNTDYATYKIGTAELYHIENDKYTLIKRY